MSKLKSTSGFTLVEFLIYIAIVVVVITVISNVIFTILDGKVKIQAIEAVAQNGRAAIDRMEQAARNAVSITTPTSGATSSQLTINTGVTSTNPTSFFLTNNVVNIKEGSVATTSIMANEVTVPSLIFQNVSGTSTPATIRIIMTVSSTNSIQDPDFDYGETFYGSATVRRRL